MLGSAWLSPAATTRTGTPASTELAVTAPPRARGELFCHLRLAVLAKNLDRAGGQADDAGTAAVRPAFDSFAFDYVGGTGEGHLGRLKVDVASPKVEHLAAAEHRSPAGHA